MNKRLVATMFPAFLLLVLLPEHAHPGETLHIPLYKHQGCNLGGKSIILPIYDSTVGRLTFKRSEAPYDAWREYHKCNWEVIRRRESCDRATRPSENLLPEMRATCASQFRAEVKTCRRHYTSQEAKCDVLQPKTEPDAGRRLEEADAAPREERELEDERERQELEEDRDSLALKDERRRLEAELAMADEQRRIERENERLRLLAEQREADRRRLAREEQERLARQQRELELQGLELRQREIEQRRLARQQRKQDGFRAMMGFMSGVAGGLAELGRSGNPGRAALQGYVDALKSGSGVNTGGSGHAPRTSGGSCEQAQRRVERRLASRNMPDQGSICGNYRAHLGMLRSVKRELSNGGCSRSELSEFDRGIAETRRAVQSACN